MARRGGTSRRFKAHLIRHRRAQVDGIGGRHHALTAQLLAVRVERLVQIHGLDQVVGRRCGVAGVADVDVGVDGLHAVDQVRPLGARGFVRVVQEGTGLPKGAVGAQVTNL